MNKYTKIRRQLMMKYFTEQIKKIVNKYVSNKEPIILHTHYFPREINLMIIDYLDNDDESYKLLKMYGIKKKYYTSRNYHLVKYVNRKKYKIDKIIIKNVNELNKINNIKTKIRRILFDPQFNSPVNNLPSTITHLTFGYMFNQAVDKLPEELTYLTFGDSFNQKVPKLPKKLIRLQFGCEFNQVINNFSSGITYLQFGGKFNQKITNLPECLEYLAFGCDFNQMVDLGKYKKLESVIVIHKSQVKLFENKSDICHITHIL